MTIIHVFEFIFIPVQCDKAVRAELLANITLSGGNTKFPGMEKRVYQVSHKTLSINLLAPYRVSDMCICVCLWLWQPLPGAWGFAASAKSEGGFEGASSSTPGHARLGGRRQVVPSKLNLGWIKLGMDIWLCQTWVKIGKCWIMEVSKSNMGQIWLCGQCCQASLKI